jgi:hypothetical protein
VGVGAWYLEGEEDLRPYGCLVLGKGSLQVSLRGAQRRGNLNAGAAATLLQRCCPTLRVIARSAATWQSQRRDYRNAPSTLLPYPPCHCEERSDVAISTLGLPQCSFNAAALPSVSLRGAQRRGNLNAGAAAMLLQRCCSVERVRSPRRPDGLLVMTRRGMLLPYPPCHCEERSDVAISTLGLLQCSFNAAALSSVSLRGAWSIRVNLMRSTLMRSTTTWQSQRRDYRNAPSTLLPYPPCHCEERSDGQDRLRPPRDDTDG